MESNIGQKIEEFEKKRAELFEMVESLSVETISARPIEGKWSILEIVEHLANAEADVLGGLPEYDQLAGKRQSLKDGLMYRIVLFVLRVGIPVKAPSKKALPEGGRSLAEIRLKWDKSQEWFKDLVADLDESGLQRAVFYHPVAGPINPEQAVVMSIAHIDTHRRQIAKRLDLIEGERAS
ncbi:MAG: DinB family protein [Pyrinomonadaceae bacterium]|nr:DinB family protein [Pyrinomonadaceae bacterium]